MSRRLEGLVLVGALLWFVVASFLSMSGKSPVVDEPIHLTSGYAYLVTRDFRLDPSHPPLVRMAAGVPLLFLGLAFPTEDPAWQQNDSRQFVRVFLFRNRVPAETIMRWGRFAIILLGATLGVVVFWWARSAAGPVAGVLALSLFAFDPNLMAHAQLVTTDMGLALLFALAVYALVRHLARETRATLWLAGAGFAAAMLAKFSAIVLIPVYVVSSLAFRRRVGLVAAWASLWRLVAAGVVMTLALAALAYAFEARTTPRTAAAVTALLDEHVSFSPRLRALGSRVASTVRVPYPSFWKGLERQANYIRKGHPGYSYLRGQRYRGGRLDYYPTALGVKTPVGTIVLLVAAFAVFAHRMLSRQTRADISLGEQTILVSVATVLAISMLSSVNIGLRHILHVYPLLFVFTGMQIAWLVATAPRLRAPVLWGASVAVALVIFSSVRAYPHYLAYFNELAGGPRNGWKYLVDSNLDWGQDLPGLKRYLDDHGIDEVFLSYQGKGPPEYYGIRSRALPATDDVARAGIPRGVVAVGVTPLFLDPPNHSWLWPFRPTATVGHSIWVFDFRQGAGRSR